MALGARPNSCFVTGERSVAVFARVILRTTLHFDGNNVECRVVMAATCLCIQIEAVHAW
jgi:hypothetical protein